MRVHHFGKPCGVDRILVDRVKLGQDAAQHCSDHVGRQPRDPLSLQEPLSQRGLANPGRAADEVENMASHGVIVPAWPGQMLLAAGASVHHNTDTARVPARRILRGSLEISDQSRPGSSPHPGQTISCGPSAVLSRTRWPDGPSASFPRGQAYERGAIVVTGHARADCCHGTILP